MLPIAYVPAEDAFSVTKVRSIKGIYRILVKYYTLPSKLFLQAFMVLRIVLASEMISTHRQNIYFVLFTILRPVLTQLNLVG